MLKKWDLNYYGLQNQKTPPKQTEPCKDVDNKISHSKINYLLPINCTMSCVTEFQDCQSLQMPAFDNCPKELVSARTCNSHTHMLHILQDGSAERVFNIGCRLDCFSESRVSLHLARCGRHQMQTWITLSPISRLFAFTDGYWAASKSVTP